MVTNYREWGYKTGGGGHMKFYTLRKGEVEKVLAMLKGGGHKQFWGSFYAVARGVGRNFSRGGRFKC